MTKEEQRLIPLYREHLAKTECDEIMESLDYMIKYSPSLITMGTKFKNFKKRYNVEIQEKKIRK